MSRDFKTTSRNLRMALGPGVQSYGPTEQLLKLVACDPSDTDEGYCRPPVSETRKRFEILEELGVFPGQRRGTRRRPSRVRHVGPYP